MSLQTNCTKNRSPVYIKFRTQHPAAHGVLRLILSMRGEQVHEQIHIWGCYIEVLKN
jgi:NADH:ubiquinone oxidoreductase subunit D